MQYLTLNYYSFSSVPTYLSDRWQNAPLNLDLSKQQVHIWRSDLNLEIERISELESILSEDELQRAERFKFERHKNQFIVARGLLRVILSSYLAVKPSNLQFDYTQHGKPTITDTLQGAELKFNLSHSHEQAIYAVTLGSDIGIDLEYQRGIENIMQLAEQFFSDREYKELKSAPLEEQQKIFLEIWTLKEAYLKATGVGLGSLQDVEFYWQRKSTNHEKIAEYYNGWFTFQFQPQPDYIAALVFRGLDSN